MDKQNNNELSDEAKLLNGEEKLAEAKINVNIFFAAVFFALAILTLIITFIVAGVICSKYGGANVFAWIARYFFDGYIAGVVFIILFIALALVFLKAKPVNNSLIVTNKRIIGTVGLAKKRVDLQISAISSIGTGEAFDSLAIATSSGRIIFTFVKNRQEIYEVINKLINEIKPQEVLQTGKISNLAELTELKNLLDAGVITQEEFDKKKKQILGL